ncbi:unnamed protein product [Prunus armeniaca]|uniref:Uncharacterized protein n=1 Tax=Prunus armeniaca TaxID=36596 RepID=A0A6J5UEE1_PRUAR|nr:unnamed protein product [Prunus armeniaca]
MVHSLGLPSQLSSADVNEPSLVAVEWKPYGFVAFMTELLIMFLGSVFLVAPRAIEHKH